MALVLLGAQPEVNCTDPQDQTSMNICAHRRYREADVQLNRVWPMTLRRAQQLDRDSAGSTPAGEAERRLRAAQRAWIAFRDAQCEVAGLEALGGSMEQLLVGSCLADMTDRRTEELMMLLASEN
jgi:uncharacterized protein YecT (DUF1311 family)